MNMTTKKYKNRKAARVINKMQWLIKDHSFEDGSHLTDWTKIEGSPWIPQIEGHELSFDIYKHDNQFWKLYIARWKAKGKPGLTYSYGGQACRMAQVQYKKETLSPHSGVQKVAGDIEWVRVEEVDGNIHRVLRKGEG